MTLSTRGGRAPRILPAAALALAALLGAPGARAQQPPPPAPAGQAPRPTLFSGGMLGGLEVPPPSPPSPEAIRVGEELDEAKREDAGRRLEWVWADVSGGFEQLGLQALSGGTGAFVAGFIPTSASGGVVSAGVGARLLYFTFLLRGRVGVFSSGQLYRLGGEFGFHVPLGRLEPRVALGLGYAQMGNLHDSIGGAAGSAIAMRGFHARAGGGVDYYVTPIFSIGGDVSAELLGLVRPALSTAQVTNIQKSQGITSAQKQGADLLLQSSTGWGGTLSVTALLGLHY